MKASSPSQNARCYSTMNYVSCDQYYDRQRGAGSMMTISAVILVLGFSAAAVLFAGWLAIGHKVRTSADVVALAGARAQALGQDACNIAEQIANKNMVQLADCVVETGYGEFVVAVKVQAKPANSGPIFSANAKAGIVEDEEENTKG